MDFSLTEPEEEKEPPRLVAPLSGPKREPVVSEPEAPVRRLEPEKRRRGRPPKVKAAAELVEPEAKSTEKVALWEPQEPDFRMIQELAELGWSSPQIADALQISPHVFAKAVVRIPRIKEVFDAGVEFCKALPERRLSWRPTAQDIEQIQMYAEEGYGTAEIAALLKVGRRCFTLRMLDCEQVRDAFEMGEGMYRVKLLDRAEDAMIDRGDDWRNVSSLMQLMLKARCGLAEKERTHEITGKFEHTHVHTAPKLKTPEAVKIEDISKFAEQEMARAKALNAQKLKPTESEVIDVAVKVVT